MPQSENIKKRKYYRKFRLFLSFFLLSIFFWIFLSLSSTYSYWTNVKLIITANEKGKFFQEKPIDEVRVKVKTTGINLIYLYFYPKKLKLNTSDFKHLDAFYYYYLPNQKIFNLQDQWKKLTLESFEKDSIKIILGHLHQKKVPVKSLVKVIPLFGYQLEKSIVVIPDSITISGPTNHLEKINSIETKAIELHDLKANFERSVFLNIEHLYQKDIVFSDSIVKIVGEVNKFTELKIELPIHVVNKKPGYTIDIYPKRAILYYQINFENAHLYNSFDFELSAFIPEKNPSILTFIPLQLTKKPDFITHYRIEPHSINYLIREEKD